MTIPPNRVKVTTPTVGTGASVSLGAVSSGLFLTPVQAGMIDGRVYDYVIEEGTNFEINSGAYNQTSQTLARGTPIVSNIGGVAGTTQLTLAGSAVVLMPPFASTFHGLYTHGADVAAAATLNLETTTGDVVDVTGNTAITAITLADGHQRTVRFTGTPTLTNGASLVLPGGGNIVATAGDYGIFRGYAGGVVRCSSYVKASGRALVEVFNGLLLTLTGVITPTSLGANTNDWHPVDSGTSSPIDANSVVRMQSATAVDLTGLQSSTAGQMVYLLNIGSNTVTLRANSASSSAGNKFLFPADVTLGPGLGLVIWKDAISSGWRLIAGGAGGAGDVVGPAGGVADGDLALFNGTTGKIIKGGGNGAAARALLYAAPFDALAYNGMQVNGSCEVAQEFGATLLTVGNGSNAFPIDAVIAQYSHAAATAVVKTQNVNTGFSGLPKCQQLVATTAMTSPGASDYARLLFSLEGSRMARLGFGYASPQSVTVGFWVVSSVAGQHSCFLGNGFRSCAAAFTINVPTAFEYKIVTFQGDGPGYAWPTDTTPWGWFGVNAVGGSSLNTPAPGVWQAGFFPSVAGSVNALASNGNSIIVTGVVVLPGTEAPSAARSPLIMRPADQELLLCQRYLEVYKYSDVGAAGPIAYGFTTTASSGLFWLPYFVPKRATPTLNISAIGDFQIVGGNGSTLATCNTLNYSNSNKRFIQISAAVASGPFSVGASAILYTLNPTAVLSVNARL